MPFDLGQMKRTVQTQGLDGDVGSPQSHGTDQCYRTPAVGVLMERAARLEREAAGLRALASALPADLANLSPLADEALWRVMTTR